MSKSYLGYPHIVSGSGASRLQKGTPRAASTPSRPLVRSQRLSPAEWAIGFAALGLILAGAFMSMGSPATHVSSSAITVRSGDTIWSLAKQHPVEGLSTAQTVEVIRDLNGLDSSTIAAGSSLMVPADESPRSGEDIVAMR